MRTYVQRDDCRGNFSPGVSKSNRKVRIGLFIIIFSGGGSSIHSPHPSPTFPFQCDQMQLNYGRG